MAIYSFKSEQSLESVHILFLDQEMNQKICPLSLCPNKTWKIEISKDTEVFYYVFIINESFWICDYKKSLHKVNGYWYSDNRSTPKSTRTVTVNRSTFCKDFNRVDYSPMNETRVFSNLDTMLGFWAELSEIKEEEIVYVQFIDPKNKLAVMAFEVLQPNEEMRRSFYFGFQISPYVEAGKWKVRLIQNEKILCEEECIIKVINNSYSSHNIYYATSMLDTKY